MDHVGLDAGPDENRKREGKLLALACTFAICLLLGHPISALDRFELTNRGDNDNEGVDTMSLAFLNDSAIRLKRWSVLI